MASTRYTNVAVALHWAMAILIIGQIAGGFYMHGLPNTSPAKFALYQLHKSFGLSILALTFVRFGWRLAHRPPVLPSTTPLWQQLAARATHWVFYALMILTPLAGWAIVSVSPKEIPTVWFGLFEIPHLPLFNGVEDRHAVEEILEERHETLAFMILFLLALHIGAALKHGFIDRDGVLRSMAPAARGAWLGLAGVLGVLCLGAAWSLSAGVRQDVAPPVSQNVIEEGLWTVDYDRSRLVFFAFEKDKFFQGEFKDFSAAIRFSEEDLENAKIDVVVNVASVSTGDDTRDQTLPGGEWFDIKNHETATFTSTEVRHLGKLGYNADGVVSIKGYEKPVTLEFSLKINGDKAIAVGNVSLVRTDFGLGVNPSWLEEEQIGLDVRVEFEIHATRAG